jgi:predicted nucleic acid-binding protein
VPTATAVKIVDASAIAAMIFGEPNAPAVAAQVRGGVLVAPALLPYELASVCLKKIKANPDQAAGLLTSFRLWAEMAINLVEIDHESVIDLAQSTGLTSYDANYLWLARKLNGELVTRDARLARAAAQPPH